MNDVPSGKTGRGRRSDFERNRAAILEAADERFRALGSRTTVEMIAKRAGCSPATVYRHFPSRDDLEAAVFELRLHQYADAIERAQLAHGGQEAFRGTIHAIVAMQARDRSFRDLLGGDPDRLVESPGLTRFASAFFAVFERARRDGVVRDEVHNEDVMLLLVATEGVARGASENSEEPLRRVVDILLDGVCRERGELTGSSLTWLELLGATRT